MQQQQQQSKSKPLMPTLTRLALALTSQSRCSRCRLSVPLTHFGTTLLCSCLCLAQGGSAFPSTSFPLQHAVLRAFLQRNVKRWQQLRRRRRQLRQQQQQQKRRRRRVLHFITKILCIHNKNKNPKSFPLINNNGVGKGTKRDWREGGQRQISDLRRKSVDWFEGLFEAAWQEWTAKEEGAGPGSKELRLRPFWAFAQCSPIWQLSAAKRGVESGQRCDGSIESLFIGTGTGTGRQVRQAVDSCVCVCVTQKYVETTGKGRNSGSRGKRLGEWGNNTLFDHTIFRKINHKVLQGDKDNDTRALKTIEQRDSSSRTNNNNTSSNHISNNNKNNRNDSFKLCPLFACALIHQLKSCPLPYSSSYTSPPL